MADAANSAPKVSLIVITRNEEELIGQCLNSAAAFCDELIVVDSFSTDRTAEIARGLGARVFERPFEGYIAQKQFAL
jgi:glycosyltransferase involved in cell wall biosynthesis